MMHWFRGALRLPLLWLFMLVFLVFLVASNVRMAFGSLTLYEFGFSRHQVDRTTGLTLEQLADAGRQIRDYFNSPDEFLDVRLTVNGTEVTLFDQREIIHMKDVKDLVHKVYRLQEGAFLFLFLFVTLGFLMRGNGFGVSLRRLLIRSSLFAIIAVGVAGAVSAIAFGPLFFLFHELSFSNDLWMLDPTTSFLLRMFPQAFWFETTLLLGVATVLEALGLIALLLLLRWWNHWRERAARRKEPQFTMTAQE